MIDLAGDWTFQLDREGIGEANGWTTDPFGAGVRLPGSLVEQGIGDPVGLDTPWVGGIVDDSFFTDDRYAPYRQSENFRVPFWYQPKTSFVGQAWYSRRFTVPANAGGKDLELFLERPHGTTCAWLDGAPLGSQDSLGSPHRYRLPGLTEGTHLLTLRVDNAALLFVGEDAHSVSDHTQGNWNGLVGRIAIQPSEESVITGIQVVTTLNPTTVHVIGKVEVPAQARFTLHLLEGDNPVVGTCEAMVSGEFRVPLTLCGEPRLWDEFDPCLYRLEVSLEVNGKPTTLSRRVGLRSIDVDGKMFALNGRRIFLRGTLDCCIFPDTGYPPTDVPAWRRVFQVCRAYGLNHIRFHSYCPPTAAFDAADELGMYLQVEASIWERGPKPGAANLSAELNQWLRRETEGILRTYGHHPSFVLMAHGNEPSGTQLRNEDLAQWLQELKPREANRRFTAGSGWPHLPESDFHVHFGPRIQGWGEGLESRVNARPPETTTVYSAVLADLSAPVIAHEIGQWCTYPDLTRLDTFQGVLRPEGHQIFLDALQAGGMESLAAEFLDASGRLQTVLMKEELESAFRTPDYAGFQMLGLQDFPGQGTAPVGVVDARWESKGYCLPEQFRAFCRPTVPLLRLSKRIFRPQEAIPLDIAVSHFGPQDLTTTLYWRLLDSDRQPLMEGGGRPVHVKTGGITDFAVDTLNLPDLTEASRLTLEVWLQNEVPNEWSIWVYPPLAPPDTDGILVTSTLDEAARQHLGRGGRVLVLANSKSPFTAHDVAFGFSTIFWNTAWTMKQAPHTLGLLCDPSHPALRGFPTDSHTDWQWWYPIQLAQPIDLRTIPGAIPIIRVIDDWFTARPLALVAEVPVETGRLLVSGINFAQAQDPVTARLYAGVLAYLREMV